MPTRLRGQNKADAQDQTGSSLKKAWPSGLDESQYAGSENWVKRQWAWEFLRRNKEFRKACGDDEKNLSASNKRKIAEKFGLIKFKHFSQEYSPNLPRFVTSQVFSWSHLSDDHNMSSRIPKELKLGQVLIRFNLEPAVSDERSISAQIAHTKKILLHCLDLYLAHMGTASKARKPKDNQFLNVLRMWDLKNSKLNGIEIAKIVYPVLVKGKTNKDEIRKIYRSRFRNVTELIEKMDYRAVAATAD